MAWFSGHVPGEDEDDWGSDFEGELCTQEIEDNKINEIREANFLKSSPSNVQDLTEDNSQTAQTITENHSVNATKTGAIPKLGFSYLNNMPIIDAHRAVQTSGKESGNIVHPQRQVSQPASQSRNLENSNRQSQTQEPSNNDAVTKQTPRKLKPEAFSFLNMLPLRNVTVNGNDVAKERKTLAPTAFSHAEKLALSQSQEATIMLNNESSDEFVNVIPSAPPLENTTSNYEPIPEGSLSECVLHPTSSNIGKENVKPPLPSRPPPVFKYPPETFSVSGSTSIESTDSIAISHPISESFPAYPKLGHSISSPDSGLKHTSEAKSERIMNSQEKNRRSLPSTPVCPAVPKRPLPPLPIPDAGNVSRIKSQDETNILETPSSVNDESRLEEAPTINGTVSSHQTNQLSVCEAPIQHTVFKEQVLQEQQISNPQHRLAQILKSQTSVDRAVLFSHQKIASAITSRAIGLQSSSVQRLSNTEESDGRPQELIRNTSGRPIENNAEQTNEGESEQQPSYLEAKEAVNSRRFPDHETLINAMNRPILPQKAAPIQRSVSCNSLVQSIKDLSFSVWSKPEKKRYSDGISLSKKNPKSISVASSSKMKGTTPLSITLIPTNAPREVIDHNHVKRDASPIDEKSTLQEYPWFHDVDAKEGHLRLQSVGQDGTFLIRPSSRPTDDIQNTLCILYNKKIRNLHIRRTADERYMLGIKTNKSFSSLAELIRYHKEFPVEILPHGSTPIKPQIYRILLRETPPKLQKLLTAI
ncbi:unnamed protein product [Larinioides sclopetarius]|uniref:SH2 domain-containing protein n=1 Tax=Larinioides sclopetarius TaxID=280406 RepID=A0AAV1YUV7_9ARAC